MKTSKLLAFHGDRAVKMKYVNRLKAHAKADEIISGKYWEDGKGCAVGCTVHSASHNAYETELGIPSRLAHLEDRIFERLYRIDPKLAKAWPLRFLKAPKIGADLSLIFPRLLAWILLDPATGVIKHAKRKATIASIKAVGALFERWIATGVRPDAADWYKTHAAAADAADAAAADAADAAAAAAAADAAARERLAFYRRNGYWSRYWFYDLELGNKGQARYVAISDKLIELLEEAR